MEHHDFFEAIGIIVYSLFLIISFLWLIYGTMQRKGPPTKRDVLDGVVFIALLLSVLMLTE